MEASLHERSWHVASVEAICVHTICAYTAFSLCDTNKSTLNASLCKFIAFEWFHKRMAPRIFCSVVWGLCLCSPSAGNPLCILQCSRSKLRLPWSWITRCNGAGHRAMTDQGKSSFFCRLSVWVRSLERTMFPLVGHKTFGLIVELL